MCIRDSYIAGPNHTLPTGGISRLTGGLTPLTFMRTQTYVKVEEDFSELIEGTAKFAELEGLIAHAAAARIRKGANAI